jgi:Mn2+/Fe2+ NRAMP family transporter
VDLLKIALGIATSIAGFLDAGSIATSAEAGASYRYSLVWAVLLGTLIVIFLTEMTGRLAAVSKHTLADAMRERLGFPYFAMPLFAELIVDWLVLAAEIGGVASALQLVTGISYQVWAIPVAFLMWLVLWLGTFGAIENGVACLGAATLVFAIGAVKLWPGIQHITAGLIPAASDVKQPQYWFTGISIIGSLMSPYIVNFYSAGAVEEKWSAKDVTTNRIVATVGMSFGSTLALGLLVICAVVLAPQGIKVESYDDVARAFTVPFGSWGVPLFAAALGVAAFGAGLEVALNLSYVFSQGLGWNWSKNLRPQQDSRFSLVYTLAILAATPLIVIGLDPLMVTNFSMALNALISPLIVFPLLILMNDDAYLKKYRNGWFGNIVTIVLIVIAFTLAFVAIPLQILGGGG